MSALGQKQTFNRLTLMSALPPKGDIVEHDRHVRFVPKPAFGFIPLPRRMNFRATLERSGPNLEIFTPWRQQSIGTADLLGFP